MPVIWQKRYFREDLQANPDVLYAYGGNDAHLGYGGQAKECRGEPNAVEIRTKHYPSMADSSFWLDDQYEENCSKLDEDFEILRAALDKGAIVVLPLDGLGTGLSKMPNWCPKTYEYLLDKMEQLLA